MKEIKLNIHHTYEPEITVDVKEGSWKDVLESSDMMMFLIIKGIFTVVITILVILFIIWLGDNFTPANLHSA